MWNFNKRAEDRLRNAAILMVLLPTIVAAACFAHGHGSLGLSGLLVILASSLSAAAVAANDLFRLIRTTRERRSRPRLALTCASRAKASSN